MSDRTSEGQWVQMDGSNDGELFWSGTGSGSAQNGNYANWHLDNGQPNDGGGGQDHAQLMHNVGGQWDDAIESTANAYVIEWDASEVLSNFTFEITDQDGTNGPLFKVDSSTGELRLANPTQPNAFNEHAIWFDPSDASSVTESGGAVSALSDLSSTGNDASETVTDNQPTLATGALNGRDALQFDGVDDRLDIGVDASIGQDPAGYDEKSISIVFQSSSDITTRQFLFEAGGGTNGTNLYIQDGQLYAGVWTENNGWNGTWLSYSIDSNTSYVATLDYNFNEGQMRLVVNGVVVGESTVDMRLSTHSLDVAIGSFSNGSKTHQGYINDSGTGAYFNGLVGEFTYYNESLTVSENIDLHAHLMNKWLGTPTTPDMESSTSHSVEVTVTDAAGNSYAETMTITVDDVNETPNDLVAGGGENLVFNGSFEDNTGSGASQTANGWTMTGTGTHIDGARPSDGSAHIPFGGWTDGPSGQISQTITTEIGQSYTLAFELGLHNSVGAGELQVEVLDGATPVLDTRVTDSVSDGLNTHVFTFVATSTSTTLQFTNTALTSGTGDLDFDNVRVWKSDLSVAENVANATVVGYALGLDEDGFEGLSYSLTEDAGGRFAIDANTGQITVADGSELDFEFNSQHTITVRATDDAAQYVEQSFVINVENVNEAPLAAYTSSQSITVGNHSFEETVLTDGQSQSGTPSWTHSSAGEFNPTATDYASSNPTDGSNLGWVNSGSLSQVLTTSFDSTLDYQLTVDVGTRLNQPNDDFTIQLYAGATLLGEYNSVGPDHGQWETLDLFVDGDSFTVADGEALEIVLSSTATQADFDNVRLTSFSSSDAAISESATDGTTVATVSGIDYDPSETLTFAIQSQDVSGAFAIDSNSGVITVADGSLLDASAADKHNVTVRVTDGEGLTHDQVITIALDDATFAVSSTGGGLSINSDGGNNAYLVADDGGNLFGGQDQLSFEVRFSTTDMTGDAPLLSYATDADNNALVAQITDSGNLRVSIAGTSAIIPSTTYDFAALRDGNSHSLGFTWDGSTGQNGAWEAFIDGQSVASGTGLAAESTIATGGTLVLGQEQDSVEGGFSTDQVFEGTLYDVRLFNDVRTAAEIAASYRSDLPYDEDGLIANWRFDQLSADGVILDAVSGNNLTLKHTQESGFTHSNAALTLSVDENALDGTVVGSVAGIDAEREALIASLLTADSSLVYSDETGKFYKFFQANESWSDARDLAVSQALNGASGQLVTIRSAFENELVHQLIDDESWLGGTDATVEGEWRWLEDGSESDLFWNGNGTGSAPSDVWANWNSGGGGQPNGNSSVNYSTVAANNGTWWDKTESDTHSFVVEWNADEVLDATQAVTYAIQSQTAAGAFAIDSDTGAITVADGTLLDADTSATHIITVRTTDVDSNTVDEAFTISLNNLIEDNNAPTDLSSGIELNTDGGNDAYLVANDGGAILGGLTELTLEMSVQFDSVQSGLNPIFSYAVSGQSNELTIQVRNDGQIAFSLGVNNTAINTANLFPELLDGELHHLGVSWDNTNGDVAFYIDGQLVETATYRQGDTIAGGGTLVIGHEQDNLGGGFSSDQFFSGAIHDLRVWNEVRSEAEISLNYQQKFDPGSLPSGLIANWQMNGFNGSNEVVDVVSGNNLIIGHATGTGFTTSTPVEDLHISENATNGATVGYVVPTDPDAPRDVVSDGLFTEAPTPVTSQSEDAGFIGDWEVVGGTDVHLHNADGIFQDTTPLGGNTILFEATSGQTDSSAIEQTLTTEAGRQYQVVFAGSGHWDTAGLKQLRVSADGQSVDFSYDQAPTNWNFADSIIWEHSSFTFTANDSSTVLRLEDVSDYIGDGVLVADIQVIEIPQAVSTILNNDPTLSYDAATGKFYRVVDASVDFSAAQNAATGSTLNGISGQLLTIRSAYENELARQFETTSNQIWLGATDADTEGDFYWLEGTQLDDSFWSGGAAGGAAAGSFANFGAGQPDNFSGVQDHVTLNRSTGKWDDVRLTDPAIGYVIEWDASEVLSSFTFEITDQDANGPPVQTSIHPLAKFRLLTRLHRISITNTFCG